jgi:PAS domain S-box-containing protein
MRPSNDRPEKEDSLFILPAQNGHAAGGDIDSIASGAGNGLVTAAFLPTSKLADLVPILIITADQAGSVIHINAACRNILQFTGEELSGTDLLELIWQKDRKKTAEAMMESRSRQGIRSLENRCCRKDGGMVDIRWSMQWDPDDNIFYCFGEDISERLLQEDLASLEKEIIHLNMQPDVTVRKVTHTLLEKVEKLYPGTICSILRLHPDNTMWNYAAPSLPREYTDLIDGVSPGPAAGSCGSAMHFDRTVIVSDIQNDPLWKDYKEIAARFGLLACWSVPIHHSRGRILGTFGIYHYSVKAPTPIMLRTIERLANLVGLLIENSEIVEDLRLSNERYKLVAQATHDMIWDWDVQKNQIFRNEEGLRSIYGFATNDPIRHINNWVERIHPEDRDRVRRAIDAIPNSRKDSLFQTEYRFLRGDGEYVFIYDRGYIMRDQNGHPVRVIGAAQDVTERVKAGQMMRDSEERYRYLFNRNPLPMWICDIETHRFLEVNERTIQHYGYTAEEFDDMTIFDIGPEEEKPRLLQFLLQRSDDTKAQSRGIWKHMRKDGETIHMEIFTHQIVYKGKIASLVLAHDVTENIQLQDQLNEERNARQEEIMKATIGVQEKERNEIGNELHDNVNQILSSAKLYMECVGLYDDEKEDYRKMSIELIVTAVEEIRRLSKSLVPPRLKDVGLIRSIEDVLGTIRIASQLSIGFSHEDFDEMKLEHGLKLSIYRIIQEQTTNIIKHAEATSVKIEFIQKTNFLVVRISDDGKGFDLSLLSKGIGFTNILNRSAVYHGRVKIVSSPGKGCSLTIAFAQKT